MADVAQLGLSVDSSQVKSATAALNQLNTASTAAAKGADRLAASGQKSETAMRAIEASAKRLGISTAEMEKRVNAAAAARQKMDNASSKAVKGMQDLSEQTKRTANDNQKLGEQTDKTSGSLDKFATRFTRGLIAGAVITAVQQLTQYVLQLNSALAQTADTAQRVGIGGQQFQGFQAAAGYKGISSADFNSAMMGFNQQVDLARHGLGDLQTLLRANGLTVRDTATTFAQVADLVRNAGSEAQKFSILQQAGLPATREFARLMEQGGASLAQAGAASTKLTDQQLREAQRINDKWNEIWTNFERWGKAAIVNVFSAFSSGGQERAPFRVVINGGTQEQAPSKPTFDPELARQQIALEQQRLGLLSPLAAVEDQVRLKQLEINAAALNNVGISKSQADAILTVTRAQAEMSRVTAQASLGIYDFAKAQQAAGDQMKAWIAQKLLDPSNPQQYAAALTVLNKEMERTADQARVAAAPLEGLQRMINEGSNLRTVLDQGAVSSLNGVSTALVDITTRTVSAADGFKNLSNSVVRAIQEMIIKITIITPLARALQGALGGFNFLGGGGGTGMSLTATGSLYANGGVFAANDNGISRYSNQVVNRPTMFAFANGVGLMGEAGAEAIMPLRRGPDGKLGVQAAGGGSGGPVINIINQSDGKVQSGGVRQNPDGSFDVFIRNAVTGVLLEDAGKNGPISKAMSGRQTGFNGS